jgi:hypothetical protein
MKKATYLATTNSPITTKKVVGLIVLMWFTLISVVSIFSFTSIVNAAPDTCTWTGEGNDNLFSNSDNWWGCDNGSLPEDGDSLIFTWDPPIVDPGSGIFGSATELPKLYLENDLNLSLDSVYFVVGDDEKPKVTYVIQGNPIALTGEIAGDVEIIDDAVGLIIDTDILLLNDTVFDETINGIVFGMVDTDATLDFDGNTLELGTGFSGTLSIYSEIIGAGNFLVKNGQVRVFSDTSGGQLNAQIVDGGELFMKGNDLLGDITVGALGKLLGTGTITGALTVEDNGILAPGLSPGCLSSGNLSLLGIYEVEVEGNDPCTEYDQMIVTGTVDIAGGTLNVAVAEDYIPSINQEFIIINNDGSDTVTGNFANYEDGDRFEVAGVTYELRTDGGDGNDVSLTAVAVPAGVGAPDTGVGELMRNPAVTLMAFFLSLGTLYGMRKLQLV